MKSRDSVIRLKRFQAEEKRRQVTQIETVIAEFERMARELDDQINAEEARTGIHDAGHFAYSTFAKAAAQRRENLKASAAELREQLGPAQRDLDEAAEELQKLEAILERDHERERGGDAEHPAGGRRGVAVA